MGIYNWNNVDSDMKEGGENGSPPPASASAYHRLNSIHLASILVRHREFVSTRSGLSKLWPVATGHIRSSS